ncbi:uncharacterized protein LY79DRAFT_669886 [Colletotrichum navitas]|uniref:AMP-dependent synthetase/ligase domain-containing protein n=1 Tax=Colletotrichum navitas TaxID=681940 RepID=A0AAD8PZH3_9PEZI|nr:uncharacterized protein LY79DRAFT_669886 [Colletotrichum navitas]KAK1590425.1 hypothetical protein LY79DRAFT_669886 [Colletotrichum navitas]
MFPCVQQQVQDSLAAESLPLYYGHRDKERIRVTRACDRCKKRKKRKIRCTGIQPCELCLRTDSHCTYNASYARGRQPPSATRQDVTRWDLDGLDVSVPDPNAAAAEVNMSGTSLTIGGVRPGTAEPSQASPEPIQTDLHGHYVGPSSWTTASTPPCSFQSFNGNVRACLDVAMHVVETFNDLFQAGQLFRTFWFTSYFAFSVGRRPLRIHHPATGSTGGDVAGLLQRGVELPNPAGNPRRQRVDPGGEVPPRPRRTPDRGAKADPERPQHADGSRQNGGPHFCVDMKTQNVGMQGQVEDRHLTSLDFSGVGRAESFVGFDASPSSSLADMTSWGQFGSMPPVEVPETVKPIELKTVTDVLLRRAVEAPDVDVLAYPATARGKDDYVNYTARDLDRFADEAARRYAQAGLLPGNPASSQAEVVAVLANSGVNYVVSMLALSRMGFAMLYLSTRLSQEAYVNLLHKTGCNRIVIADRYSDMAARINALSAVSTYAILDKAEYDLPAPSGDRFPVFSHPDAVRRISFIVHSPGSTGLPKPIFQTHAACISNYSSGIPYRAFLTLPLFHNHGIATLFRAIYAGKRIAIYNANQPLSGTTPAKAMAATEPGSLHCVPYALKLLAETEGGIAALQRLKLVLYGGSSCPEDLGNRLVEAGVYLVGHYGATEMGQLMTSFRAAFYKQFGDLIEAVYRRFEAPKDNVAGGGVLALDLPQLEDHLLDLFRSTLGFSRVEKDTDFFEANVDSLQASTAWGRIQRGLDLGGNTLGQNAVFEYHNVLSLSKHAYSLRTGESVDAEDEIDVMTRLIAKYSEFTERCPGTVTPEGEAVIRQPYVKTVYCLVRASFPEETKSRVTASLTSKGLVLGAASFEAQHIRGVRNLLDFCLGTETVRPAQNMGYARSKVVTEHIVKAAAATKTGMTARMEEIPLMIRSAKVIKALPVLDETPSWMPADKMALAVLELAGLAGPRCTSCGAPPSTPDDADLDLVYQIVSQREWVRRLRASDPDPERNPTYKLLGFFEDKYDDEGPGRQGLVFETERTGRRSGAVGDGWDVVGSGLVERMVRWMETQW